MNAMFIGASASGKTTLIQRLCDKLIRYDKTQAVEYVEEGKLPDCCINRFIDTPGEYMQVRSFWCSLTTISYDADLICLVQDSTSEDCWFSGGISSKFAKPVIGIVTKTDDSSSDKMRAKDYLMHAGCRKIFPVSAFTNDGVLELLSGMQHVIDEYHEENRYSYASDYFD